MTARRASQKLELKEFPAQIESIRKELRKFNDSVLDALKLQIALLSSVQPEKLAKTARAVKRYRNKKWSGMLKKSKGDVDKAYEEYTNDAFFC